MVLLFRLPLMLLELLLRRLMGRDDDDGATFVPTPAPPTPAPGPTAADGPLAPPSPTAEEAIARRVEREAARAPAPAPAPAPPPAPAPAPAAPRSRRARRSVLDNGHVDSEPTVVESFGPAGDVGSAITVDEPWDGYDGMAATAVIARVRGSDEATKAVVRLYEQQHKARATVLRATG
jgi:hypothetical protein